MPPLIFDECLTMRSVERVPLLEKNYQLSKAELIIKSATNRDKTLNFSELICQIRMLINLTSGISPSSVFFERGSSGTKGNSGLSLTEYRLQVIELCLLKIKQEHPTDFEQCETIINNEISGTAIERRRSFNVDKQNASQESDTSCIPDCFPSLSSFFRF